MATRGVRPFGGALVDVMIRGGSIARIRADIDAPPDRVTKDGGGTLSPLA